ncbi:hypothetical protein EON65_54390 [archaeon]|nr:MAG: hypothetical protein EON65_54390 [archaeon]
MANTSQYQRLNTSVHGAKTGQGRLVTEVELNEDNHIENPLQVPGLHTHDLDNRVHTQFVQQFRDIKLVISTLHAQHTCMLLVIVILATISVINFLSLLANRLKNDDAMSNEGFYLNSIAFGSCTAYDLRDWHIFDDAIIPSQVEGWIWTGDFVYLDDGEINCSIFEPTRDWQASCNCSASWINQPPYSCHAGNEEYASSRWMKALSNGPYHRFLQYMCPSAMQNGVFPPPGNDPLQCARPLWGIYDDHDYGWNNGNSREPHKSAFKNMYLDAIGEPADSIRRNNNRPHRLRIRSPKPDVL